jgi:hypothetical protein
MVSGIATNSVGGVKSLSLKFTCPGGNVCQSAQVSATPDASNKVSTVLRILGGNGSGGAGNQPLLFTIGTTNAGIYLNLDATATNFNGMTSSIHVLYRVKPVLPVIKLFDASPKFGNNGIVSVGQTATLTWNVQCSDNCNFGIQGHDTLNTLVLNAPKLNSADKLPVTPSVDTKYTLTAINSVGSVSKDIWVTLSGGGPSPTGAPYYFKMTCPTCSVTPCFTVGVYTSDPTTQAAILENQNGGYTATQIDPSEVLTACQ